MNKPRCTVLLPVNNGMPYLIEAVNSVLNQTYKNFLLFIINNGSTDDTELYLESLSDCRIKLLKIENKSLVDALNYGLKHIRTDYVMRMDSDDIIHPSKIEKQINFLDKYSFIDIVGTEGSYFYQNMGRLFSFKLPSHDENIKKGLLNNIHVILHGTIMFRSIIVEKGVYFYLPEAFPCEDYELFLRIHEKVQFANIKENLYFQRIHQNSTQYKNIRNNLIKHYYYYNLYVENTNDKKLIVVYWNILKKKYFYKFLMNYLTKNKVKFYLYLALYIILQPIKSFNKLILKFID